MLVWEGHTEPVISLAFAPDGGSLATGDRGGRVLVRDVLGGREFDRPTAMPTPATALAYRPDGVLYRANGSLVLSLHPADPPATGFTLDSVGFDEPVTALTWAWDRLLAVGCGDRLQPRAGHFLLWDEGTGLVKKPKFLEPAGVKAVAVHAAARLVAWANGSRRVTVWDTRKADPAYFNQTHSANDIAWHPDGLLLAATADRLGKVYDVAARREKLTLKGHTGQVTAVAFSPDGRHLVTGSWDGTVRLWDPATGSERERFDWGVGRVLCLAFDRDGQRLAAGGDKGTVAVWDV
jgi:WD40 repeat protein